MDKDPRIVKPQDDLAQAQQTIGKFIEETVPQEKYQNLQQQFKNINASKSEAFDKCRKEYEKVEKVKNMLNSVISRMDTLYSPYTDVLACRAPAKNYAFHFVRKVFTVKN